MQDLIEQYQEQLQRLEARKQRLEVEKKKLRGREYFQALRRLDTLEQECLEMSCTLAWMVKEYGNGGPSEKMRRGLRPWKTEAACG